MAGYFLSKLKLCGGSLNIEISITYLFNKYYKNKYNGSCFLF